MLFYIGGIFLLYRVANAQVPFFDDPGFNPHREYFNQAFNEHIDPFTGNLILTYTDIFLPGNGGLDLKIQRIYNSKIYLDFHLPNAIIPDSWVGMGWSLHMGRILNPGRNDGTPILEMPDGSKHPMYIRKDAPANIDRRITKDFWLCERVDNGREWRVMLTDGTIYIARVSPTRYAGPSGTIVNYWPVYEIIDTNGNKIIVEYEFNNYQEFIKKITDSVGRFITFTYNPNSERKELESITVDGKTWRYYYDEAVKRDGTKILGYSLLKEVKPPTGASWLYEYNTVTFPEFELIELTYPTGARINYTYDFEKLTVSNETKDYRVVTKRIVSGRGVSTGTWTYDYQFGVNITGITTITYPSPSGIQEKYYFFGAGFGIGIQIDEMWKIGLLIKKEILQGTTVLERTSYAWSNPIFISLQQFRVSFLFTGYDRMIYVPILQSTTIERGGKTYKTTYSAFDDYGNPQTIEELGERSRTTNRIYDHRSDFVTKNITNLVKEETVSGGGKNFKTTFNYDSNGSLISKNELGVVTNFTYYNDGNLKTATDANNHTITYSNYRYGAAEMVTNSEYTIRRNINFTGTVNWEEDGNGNRTIFDYDALNRLTKIDLPGTETTINIDYAPDGSWRKVTQGINWVRYNYDGLGRQTSTENSEVIKTIITYNSWGEKLFQSYPFTTSMIGDNFQYDALGRVTKITHPDASSITYTYSGNSVSIKNERNFTAAYTYESYGSPEEKLLVKVVDPVTTTSYAYNILGSLTEISQASGLIRTFSYNEKDFLEHEIHPENGKTTYTRDNVGNIKTKTDANGNTLKYTYDGLNRLRIVDYPTGIDTEYDYDHADNLKSVTNASGTYTFTYSPTNRLTLKKYTLDRHAYQILYDYDANGNMSKLTYPSGKVLDYPRDTANRIKSVGKIVSRFEYHPSGGVEKITFANGVTTTIGYDPKRYWVKSIQTDANVLNLVYDYDDVGNVMKITDRRESRLTKTFTYDAIDRLETADGPWGQGAYKHDMLGNRMEKTFSSIKTTYKYDTNKNRLISTSSRDSSEVFDFAYDENGNMTGNGRHTFDYNFENQINSVDKGAAAQYVYDGQKRRVKKVFSADSVIIYHYDQDNNVIAETDAKGKTLREFVHANGRLLAMIKPEIITRVEPIPEIVSLIVDGTELDGSFASSRPTIEAAIVDKGGKGISLGGIELLLDEFKVDLKGSNFDARNGHLIYQAELHLKQGKHIVEFRVKDNANNGPAIKRLEFLVEGLKLRGVLNYPNPFNRETSFTYVLTDYADEVTIKIYTLSGKLIRTIKNAPHEPNFNQVTWDGLDEDGDALANGVYLYKVIARQEDKIVEAIEKFVIAR